MQNNRKSLFIVIPVHNRKRFTRDCLLSLRKQTFKNFTIIVIDDGSSDGTSEMIQKIFPEVVLLHGDGNLWWAQALNIGVNYVLNHSKDNDYILTLNNDTVVYPDYLQKLHDSALDYPKSLIGSISISIVDQSTVIDAGVRVNWSTAKFINLGKDKKYYKMMLSNSFIQKVDVLSGRGTLIPIDTFREIGLYDFEHLPHYGADYEFSYRANLKGYSLFINNKAVVLSNARSTGLNNRVNRLRWCDLMKSFFSIRSPNNLKYRWNFARLCCKGWRLPVFYLCDVGRLIIGAFLAQLGLITET